MSFKVGDMVLCIESITPEVNGPQAGTIYRVISIDHDSIGIFLPKCTYDEETKLGRRPNWGSNAFKLISEGQPLNEYDYLDNIQRNFKYSD